MEEWERSRALLYRRRVLEEGWRRRERPVGTHRMRGRVLRKGLPGKSMRKQTLEACGDTAREHLWALRSVLPKAARDDCFAKGAALEGHFDEAILQFEVASDGVLQRQQPSSVVGELLENEVAYLAGCEHSVR